VRRGATRAVLAACALAGVGCLDKTPATSSGYAGEVPLTDAGVAEVTLGDALTDGAVAAWAGTWTFTTGAQGLMCGGSISAGAVSGNLAISASSSGRALIVQEDGCSFVFTLDGETATSEPNQSCAAWAVATIPTWTLTMQPDGTLVEKLGGDVWLDGVLCQIWGGSTLVRQ
jgi:hypothetical protein